MHTNLTNEMLFSQRHKMDIELRRLTYVLSKTIHDVVCLEAANV